VLQPAAAALAELKAGVRKDPKRHEKLFEFQCRALRLPPVVREFRFAEKAFGKRWRFDFYWPEYLVAVEIEGLVVRKIGGETVVTGRHATITGMREDMDKYNHAALLGIYVLRFEQGTIKGGEPIAMTQRVLAARGWKGPT